MKKSFTLIEVVVATAILSIALVAALSIYIASVRIEQMQDEFAHFQSICLDIDAYWDHYEKDWSKFYFGEGYEFDSVGEVDTKVYNVYYSSSFEPTEFEETAAYKLSFYYQTRAFKDSQNNSRDLMDLFVSVEKLENHKMIIDDIEYGVSYYYEETN